MHILVVEALLIATYSTWGRANTYTQKKTLSVENLSRANSWSLSSCACPAGSCPAGSLSSWPIPAVVYEPANSNRHAAYSQHQLSAVGQIQITIPLPTHLLNQTRLIP